jgi:hypothetical protein
MTLTVTTVTADDTTYLQAMRLALENLRTSNEWLLVAPDGRVWITADVQDLFMVLSPHHPLLKVTT